MKKFKIFSDPRKIYRSMIKEINSAKTSVYLETYTYGNDKTGTSFREALEKKAKQGVNVKILADAWGSSADKQFFQKLTKLGGEVKFFKEFQHVIRVISKNHERNHRKLLIIDNKIAYIGSINITSKCLDWRELVLKIEGPIIRKFTESFLLSWNSAGKLNKTKLKALIHKGYEIIQDMPGDLKSLVQDRYLKLIKNAKNEVLIETPYFIPPIRIRRALAKAVKRGVRVKILLPEESDVHAMDIVRNRYLGYLYKNKIDIFYYLPNKSHSKLLIVDSKFFLLGSSNLDYRSFLHDREINLFGNNREISCALKEYFESGLKESRPFDYQRYKSRSSLRKLAEIILNSIAHYL